MAYEVRQQSMVKVVWEVVEDRRFPGDWRVESTGSDGECYVTIFCNETAEKRARDYAAWMNSRA